MKLPTLESYWSESGLIAHQYSGDKFRSYFFPDCRYPLTSMVFADRSIGEKEVSGNEKHFKAKKWGNPYLTIESKVDPIKWKKLGYRLDDYKLCHSVSDDKICYYQKGYNSKSMIFHLEQVKCCTQKSH